MLRTSHIPVATNLFTNFKPFIYSSPFTSYSFLLSNIHLIVLSTSNIHLAFTYYYSLLANIHPLPSNPNT